MEPVGSEGVPVNQLQQLRNVRQGLSYPFGQSAFPHPGHLVHTPNMEYSAYTSLVISYTSTPGKGICWRTNQ